MVNENTQSFVQTPADGAGKRLDTRYFTTSAGTVVHREVMAIGGTAIGQIAVVTGGALTIDALDNLALYSQLPKSLGQQTAASSLSIVMAPRAIAVLSPTAASFLANVTVLGNKSVRSETAASFLVTMPGAKTVLSPTAASFLVTVPGAKTVLSPTAASFNATISGSVTILGAKNVLSATAASFNVTVAEPVSVDDNAGSLTVDAPGYVRAQSATAASFLVTMPGAKTVLSPTAASFLVTVPGAKNVLSATAASFNAVAQVPGRVRVYSETAASFLVTSVGGSGFRNVTSNTAASFNVTVAGAKTVLSPTAASFSVNAVGVVADNTTNPTTTTKFPTLPAIARASAPSYSQGSVVALSVDLSGQLRMAGGGSGFRNVTSNTAASFNITVAGAKTVLSPTAASFVVLLYAAPASTLGTTISLSGTVPVALFNAPGASLRNYITSITASNRSLATNTEIGVFDRNTSGRVFAQSFMAAAGGGLSLTCPVPLRGNTNSTMVVRVTPTAGALISAQGYTAA